MTIRAIIPAAGRSRRMGTPKQLMDYDGRTMLEAVLAPLLQPGIASVVVVTHSGLAAATQALLGAHPTVRLAINDDEHSAMIDSIRIALREAPLHEPIAPHDGWLIVPSDQPGIPPQAVAAVCAAFAAAPDRIALATHDDRRGHPMIFPAALADAVQGPLCDAGLRALLHAHEAQLNLVPCASPAVLRNVNTPQDYARLREQEQR